MKKLLILIVALAALAGCKSQETVAYKYFRDKPDKLAALCATNYPVKDSVGALVVKPANNTDYTQTVDDLNRQVLDLREQTVKDSIKISQGGEIGAQDVTNYKSRINTLQKQINDLRANYRPCKPDTVQISHYIENTAKVAALSATIQALTNNNAVLTDNLQTNKKELDKVRGQRNRYRWGIIAFGLAALAFIIFKVVKK